MCVVRGVLPDRVGAAAPRAPLPALAPNWNRRFGRALADAVILRGLDFGFEGVVTLWGGRPLGADKRAIEQHSAGGVPAGNGMLGASDNLVVNGHHHLLFEVLPTGADLRYDRLREQHALIGIEPAGHA